MPVPLLFDSVNPAGQSVIWIERFRQMRYRTLVRSGRLADGTGGRISSICRVVRESEQVFAKRLQGRKSRVEVAPALVMACVLMSGCPRRPASESARQPAGEAASRPIIPLRFEPAPDSPLPSIRILLDLMLLEQISSVSIARVRERLLPRQDQSAFGEFQVRDKAQEGGERNRRSANGQTRAAEGPAIGFGYAMAEFDWIWRWTASSIQKRSKREESCRRSRSSSARPAVPSRPR